MAQADLPIIQKTYDLIVWYITPSCHCFGLTGRPGNGR